MHAIGVCACVDRVSQDRQDPVVRRRPPFQLPDAPAALSAESQSQVIDDQITEDRVGGTELIELVEDQLDHPPRLFVRLLDDIARGRLEVSQGDGQEQLAALRLVPAAAEQAVAHRNQFILTHGAFHAKEEAIVAVQGVVDAVLVAQQGVEDAADVDEAMPFGIRPRHPAELQPQHDPHMAQGHFRHQPLVARAIVGGLAAAGLILVDDDHALGRPAEPLRELRQGILPFARLAVLEHLLRRGLPHIHDREPIEVPISDLRRRPEAEGHGRRSRPGRGALVVNGACITRAHRAPPDRREARRVVESRCC